jgi:hypothetical protein
VSGTILPEEGLNKEQMPATKNKKENEHRKNQNIGRA